MHKLESRFMFSIIKTATKETLFYKLPALVGDILIQVGTLLFPCTERGWCVKRTWPSMSGPDPGSSW